MNEFANADTEAVNMAPKGNKLVAAILKSTSKVSTSTTADQCAAVDKSTVITQQFPVTDDIDDGFFTVFPADKNIDDTTEDEGFELIGPHNAHEAVVGKSINAEPVETEPGVPAPATCNKIIKV